MTKGKEIKKPTHKKQNKTTLVKAKHNDKQKKKKKEENIPDHEIKRS